MSTFSRVGLLILLLLGWGMGARAQSQNGEESSGVFFSGNNNIPPQEVRTMAEWEETQGVVIAWRGFPEILSEIVRYAKDEGLVYIVTTDDQIVRDDLSEFQVNDLENIRYVIAGVNSIWIRDYGPWTVYLDKVSQRGISDYLYNRPMRPRDDMVPYEVADYVGDPVYNADEDPFSWVHTGGNFLRDGLQTAYSSDLVLRENSGKTGQQIAEYAKVFFGVEDYRILSRLDYDTIHHLDMHMRILDEETMAIGEYPEGVADGPVIEQNLAWIRNHYRTPYGRPYRIMRLPMPSQSGQYPPMADYLTYTNSVFINKTILVPIYEVPEDEAALQLYRDYFPGYRVVGINCNTIISRLGALHCITKLIGVRDPLWIAHPRLRDTYNSTSSYLVEAWLYHQEGIASASLHYRLADESAYFTVPMQVNADDPDKWEAGIPPQEPGREVQYYIEAWSNDGKQQLRPLPAPEGYYNFRVNNWEAAPAVDWVQTLTEVAPGTPIHFTDDSKNGATSRTWSFPGGEPLQATSEDIIVRYEDAGIYEVSLELENPVGERTLTREVAVQVRETLEPFNVDFDNSADSPWEIIDPEADSVQWEWRSDVGCNGGCLEVEHREATQKLNREYLRTGLDLRQYEQAHLLFKVAYAQRHPAHFDELRINLLDQQGQRHNIYNKGGNILASVDSFISDFEPVDCSQWRTDTVSLATWNGEQFLLEFESIGDRGNSIFLDEIEIVANRLPNAAIVYPENESLFLGDGLPLSDVVTVEATDLDGTIAQVDFFLDSELLGSQAEAPYEVPFILPAVGTYFLQARASDDRGAQVWTERVEIRYDFESGIANPQQLPLSLSLAPNPVSTSSELIIQSDQRFRAAHFSILDARGRLLQEWSADILEGENRMIFAPGSIAAGSYQLVLKHGDQYYQFPWIKI